jgi:hypothetical protein
MVRAVSGDKELVHWPANPVRMCEKEGNRMAFTSPSYEHKVLVWAKGGIMREDGKRLFGSFVQRRDELVHEGWRITMTWPRMVTFKRKTDGMVRDSEIAPWPGRMQ